MYGVEARSLALVMDWGATVCHRSGTHRRCMSMENKDYSILTTSCKWRVTCNREGVTDLRKSLTVGDIDPTENALRRRCNHLAPIGIDKAVSVPLPQKEGR